MVSLLTIPNVYFRTLHLSHDIYHTIFRKFPIEINRYGINYSTQITTIFSRKFILKKQPSIECKMILMYRIELSVNQNIIKFHVLDYLYV